jgi:hypothetical protein
VSSWGGTEGSLGFFAIGSEWQKNTNTSFFLFLASSSLFFAN